MDLPRRTVLRMGAACLVSGVASSVATSAFGGVEASAAFGGVATPALAGQAKSGCRSVSLQSLHTGERLTLDYWVNGDYLPDAMTAVNKLLRDFRTNDVHAIDPQLIDLLSGLNGLLESDAPFQVISGYRSPASNAMLHSQSSGVAAKSLHMEGKAIDVRLPGRPLATLHKAALSMRAGGVGNYPKSDFVHVDVGRVRYWGEA